MSFDLAGLPGHILLVHAVVVLVPLTAALTVLATCWPAARRRLGLLPPLLTLLCLPLVAVTAAAGEALLGRIGPLPAALDHADLGRRLLPWVLGWAAAAALDWMWHMSRLRGWLAPRLGVRGLRRGGLVVAFLTVAGAMAALVAVTLVGESGARAVWGGA